MIGGKWGFGLNLPLVLSGLFAGPGKKAGGLLESLSYSFVI
jgi:hypothetical protein